MTTTITTSKISERPNEIREFVGGSIDISVGRYIALDTIYKISSFMSFVSLWITTLILLYRYKNNLLHTLVFILILSLPLIYFLISYSYEFIFGKLLVSFLMNDPITISIILTVLLSLSKPIGGLTFGFAFWRIAKTIGYEKTIKMHMIISGWGILLLFGTNQASNQVLVPYPPFGLATITVLILASYMTLLGIYNAARLVSVNLTLRKTIRKHALESNLLESIGQAEMENEIRKTVNRIIQDKDIIKMPIDTKLEFDKNELRKYIDSVITEVKHEGNK
jgi:RNA-binding protein YhbY